VLPNTRGLVLFLNHEDSQHNIFVVEPWGALFVSGGLNTVLLVVLLYARESVARFDRFQWLIRSSLPLLPPLPPRPAPTYPQSATTTSTVSYSLVFGSKFKLVTSLIVVCIPNTIRQLLPSLHCWHHSGFLASLPLRVRLKGDIVCVLSVCAFCVCFLCVLSLCAFCVCAVCVCAFCAFCALCVVLCVISVCVLCFVLCVLCALCALCFV
jgi:hypothetical protein